MGNRSVKVREREANLPECALCPNRYREPERSWFTCRVFHSVNRVRLINVFRPSTRLHPEGICRAFGWYWNPDPGREEAEASV